MEATMNGMTRRTATTMLIAALGTRWARADDAMTLRVTQDTPIILLPFFVARELKLWEKNGVSMTPVPSVIGMPNLIAVTGGSIDVGISSIGATTIAALNHAPIKALGSFVRFEAMELACSVDLRTPADIVGKKIAILQGTDSQYYLNLLTRKYKIAPGSFVTVRLNPAEMASALASGAIDGFIWQEPFLTKAVAINPLKFHRLADAGLMTLNAFATTTEKAVQQKQPLLVNALRTLDDACRFIKDNPEQAVSIGARYAQIDPAIASSAFSRMELSLALDVPSYSREMHNVAEWAISDKVVRPDLVIPDFSVVFAPEVFSQVKQS
jgi:ABC-type nitrate/sulfonate/bicarbonate transport system substrate-binding protein